MKSIDVIAATLLVIGGINWGLIATADVDLVAALAGAGAFGAKNALSSLIYGIVGLAALYQALTFQAIRRRWAHAQA